MSESERWLYSGGSTPRNVRRFMNALLRRNEPSTREPFTGEPFTGEPFTGEPFTSEPFTGEPFTGEPSRGEPSRREPPVATRAPSAPGKEERSAGEVGATVRSPTLVDRTPVAPPAEPLVDRTPVAPRAEPLFDWLQTFVHSPPVEVRAPEAMTITAELNIPPEVREQLGKLPFRAPAAEEFARTMKVHEHNWRQGKTAPLEDGFIAKIAPALPFAKNTVGAAVVQFPPLTLEEYALFRAELAVSPERWLEIWSQYKVVNDTARQVMDEHWQAELAASPGARARFEEALADYTASLRP